MSTLDLTASYNVGRRMSGSSSKVSLRDEDMESLDFNINDISRASSPASISAKSEGHLNRDRRHRHSFRGDEDYRRRYSKLKAELEIERGKVKTMNKDKIEEMRQIREFYENERRQEHAAIQKKFEEEKKKELVRMKEEMIKQKDYELQQVLKYKEEEIKSYRAHTPASGMKTPISERSRTPAGGRYTPGFETPRTPRTLDRPLSPKSKDGAQSPRGMGRQTPALDTITDEILRAARLGSSREPLDRTKTPSERARTPDRARTPGGGRMTPMLSREQDRVSLKDTYIKVHHMEQEIARLTKEKDEIQTRYKEKCKSEEKKDKDMKTMKDEYEHELRRVIGEYKKVALGNLQKLKMAEHALREGSMKEGDVLNIPLSNPQSVQVGIMSATSPASTEDGTPATVGTESGDEGSKREEREKEKTLQKKIGELQTQTQRLERRVMLLRTENDGLKKKQEEQKPLEEKVKVLKKRNAELAAIARRLEEKAKALQQENAKNRTKTKEDGVATADGEHLKRVFARQRAKDLAEHAKNMLAKDREIEDLRKKCQELADTLSNGDVMAPQNVQIYEEKEELVNIVKQAAKERLQLEQQLAHSKTRERSQGDDQEREKQRKELEAANDILHKEIEKLEQALKQTEGLKEDLSQKNLECDTLTTTLVRLKEQQSELEDELQSTSAKNAQFAVQVDSLEERLKDHAKVKEECSTLRVTLAAAQTDRESAKEQVSTLQTRVNSLENLVRDLQESAEQLQSLEHDYKDALSQLATKQHQIDQLQEAQKESKAEHEKSVTQLQGQIRELEVKCKRQEEQQGELKAELQTLQQQKSELDTLLKQQQQQLQSHTSSARRHGSPISSGGIPPSDSADSGLPASGTNSDEGVSHPGQGTGSDGHPALDSFTAPDTSSKSHDTEPEDSGMESRKDTRSEQILLSDSRLSALAMRGPIQVYVAKYSYNPFEYSPNENPEAELQLNAGDYVLVLGDMDEDGFFEGELIDGRRGLVPSNFIERVADEDLGEFHAALALSGGQDDSSHSAKPSVPSPLDSDNEDVADNTLGVNGRVNKNILNNNNNSYDAPHPHQLVLDRQLTTSVLISWQPPQGIDVSSIQAYHVYLDGALKTTLKGSERTKALLEDVSASQNHRISVRCLSNQGQSKDSQCTMLIGRDVLPVPSDVGVRNVTQSSACINWMPGNSNHPHAILLNGREAKVVKPGVCNHTLTGLAPSTVYRVTIATRPVSGLYGERHKWSQDKVSCNIEFKTLVGGAVPDAPLNVQVEAGPREGTVLLTWLPVTINSSGFSNGAVVTGYVVYADGNRIKEAKGPTNDHMVLGREDFKGYIPKQLTVRTATVDHLESVDSVAVHLPHNVVREVMTANVRTVASEAMRAASARKSPKVSGSSGGEPPGHDTDEEIEAAFQETETSSPEIETHIAEPFAESSSSELSDILEVEEELGGDESNQNGETSLANLPSQGEKTRKSPKPAPRKVSPSVGHVSGEKEAEFSVKQFHGQKPDPSRKDGLLTTPMIVPAIEITRDSSTERGGSFEDDADGSGSSQPTQAKEATVQHQQHRRRSAEDMVEKPLPAHDPVTQRYRSSGDEPSAFRSVEQGKQRASVSDSHSPDSAKPKDSTTRSPTHRPGSGQRTGSAHSTPSHKGKDERVHEEKASALENAPPKPARRTPSESEEANDRDSITEEMNRLIDDSTVRLFIALFDYDPITMSPNVDCVDEELPFREGQILKVYGDKDADGFYRGEADGREGFIPCNMVSEIHIDDPELVEQLLKENQTNNAQQSSSTGTDGKGKSEGHLTPNGVAPLPAAGPVRRMVAMYDYDPQELSPNVDSELELSFKQGDIIYITGEMDEDGFFAGELSGVRGLVPSNFLQEAPLSDEDEVLDSASMVSPSRSQGSISAASRRSDSLSTLNNVGDGGGGCPDSPALHVTAGVLTAHPPPATGGASPDGTQRSTVPVTASRTANSPRRAHRP